MDSFQTDGRTFEAFCSDPLLWANGAFIDHGVVLVNGVRIEDHVGDFTPHDRISVHGGYVHCEHGVLSLRHCFSSWLRGRSWAA